MTSYTLTPFTSADPDRFRADFNAAHGQEVVTLLAVGDPALMEKQINVFLDEQLFLANGPLSRGWGDPSWNLGTLGTDLGVNVPADTYTYPGPADVTGDLIWGDVQLGHAYRVIAAANLLSVTGTLNAGDGGDTTVMTVLESMDLSNLASVGGDLIAAGDAVLASLDLSSLASVGGDLNLAEDDSLVFLDLSSLISIGGNFDVGVSGDSMPPTFLTSVDLSSLASVGGSFSVGFRTSMISLDVSSLASVGDTLYVINNTSLVSLDLSALVMLGGGFSVDDDTSLTSLDLSSLTSAGGNFRITNAALSQVSVDAVLVKLASLDGTGGTTLYENHSIDLSGGTSAAPGSSGLTAKATLEGRGCTVSVNS